MIGDFQDPEGAVFGLVDIPCSVLQAFVFNETEGSIIRAKQSYQAVTRGQTSSGTGLNRVKLRSRQVAGRVGSSLKTGQPAAGRRTAFLQIRHGNNSMFISKRYPM